MGITNKTKTIMKKEYLIYKLSEDLKEATRIENELFRKFDVKRGLRNEDGTGVLVGLTKIGNVVGYERIPGGGLKLFPANCSTAVMMWMTWHTPSSKRAFRFEEIAYLLLPVACPTRKNSLLSVSSSTTTCRWNRRPR